MHAKRFKDRPHRAARDDPCSRFGSAHDHPASTVATGDVVMQCPTFSQRHANHATSRLLGGLANCFRYLPRFARTVTNPTFAIANHDEGRKTEPPAAFDDLCHSVDVDQLLGKFSFLALARLSIAIAASAPFPLRACHASPF